MANKDYRVGIYARLSQEDEKAGESASIENQLLMLTAHVKAQGWELVETYADDGFSGTNQNRPALQQMLADVKRGHINLIAIKDLSRLGRNYLEVGTLQEVFLPEHGCELISLSEKIDDMTVFRNFFNEQYAKDTSKKVRAVKKMCAQNGKFIGAYAPYGYCKDQQNKHLLVPDPNVAPIVQKIFQLRSEGEGYVSIAQYLNNNGIPTPRDYFYQQKGQPNPCRMSHSWTNVTVKGLLVNEVYIGNLVQFQHRSTSYKNRKLISRPEDEWIRTENTHEPIITQDVWERTQALTEKRRSPHKRRDGNANLFTGIVVCGDCGFNMRGATQRKVRKNGNLYEHTNYACGAYFRGGRSACTPHMIGEKVLHNLVVAQIREHARMVELDEGKMIENILLLRSSESEASCANYMSELKAHQNRLSMLEKLIEKLYEDRLVGAVPETMFTSLVRKYEQERIDRKQSVEDLERRLREAKNHTYGAEKWAEQIRQYTALETLDIQTLVLLVNRIEIGEAKVVDGQRVCDIRIVYNYVGDIGGLRLTVHESPEGEAVPYGQAV